MFKLLPPTGGKRIKQTIFCRNFSSLLLHGGSIPPISTTPLLSQSFKSFAVQAPLRKTKYTTKLNGVPREALA